MRTIDEQETAPWNGKTAEVMVLAKTRGAGFTLVCVTGTCRWNTSVWGSQRDAEAIAANHTRGHFIRRRH